MSRQRDGADGGRVQRAQPHPAEQGQEHEAQQKGGEPGRGGAGIAACGRRRGRSGKLLCLGGLQVAGFVFHRQFGSAWGGWTGRLKQILVSRVWRRIKRGVRAEQAQLVHGAEVGALEPLTLALNVGQAGGAVAELLVGQRRADVQVHAVELGVDLGIHQVHGHVEKGRLDFPGTAQEPLRGDHVADDVGLDGVGGLEAGEVAVTQAGVFVRVFAGHDEDAGKHAVDQAVGGGAALALLGFRAAGLLAVGARGCDLLSSTHEG